MVGEREDFVAEARDGCGGRDTVGDQPGGPERQAVGGHGERGGVGLTVAGATAAETGPREEREDRAGRADAVTVVEVIGGRVVEVHGALDQAQAEDAGVEIDVTARIAGDRGNVMQACEKDSGGGLGRVYLV